jgi:hypothetical protein
MYCVHSMYILNMLQEKNLQETFIKISHETKNTVQSNRY